MEMSFYFLGVWIGTISNLFWHFGTAGIGFRTACIGFVLIIASLCFYQTASSECFCGILGKGLCQLLSDLLVF